MKWTPEQVDKLRELCEKGVPNADIAAAIGCKVTDVHAKRSQMGITRDKIKASQQATPVTASPGENPHMKVKVAFKALHTALSNAVKSSATTEGQASLYSSADDLIGTVETLVFKVIQQA